MNGACMHESMKLDRIDISILVELQNQGRISNVEEVMECHLISGGFDYLLRFLCRNIKHYQEVVESVISSDLGIEKHFSYIVIKSPLHRESVPLRNLLQE